MKKQILEYLVQEDNIQLILYQQNTYKPKA